MSAALKFWQEYGVKYSLALEEQTISYKNLNENGRKLYKGLK